MVARSRQSVINLYPYQRAFFKDAARVLVGIWCRQGGKDFTAAAKAVDHGFRTPQPWYIVSLTQRQADATFSKCRSVAKAIKGAVKARGALRESERDFEDYDREIDHAFRCVARTLHLPGGGTVTSLPGRDPDTLAGLTGNIIFTEFGLFPGGGYDHWRVVFPLATRGFRIVVISTPRGKNTKLFELAQQTDLYSVHVVDIHRAVAEGMPLRGEDGRPISVEALRKLYGDEMGWRREYLCEFTGDAEALITWAKLVAAGERGEALPFDWLHLKDGGGWRSGYFRPLVAAAGRPEIGWDVARRRHLSSVWVNLDLPGGTKHLRYLVVMERCSFALQREILQEAMGSRRDAVGCGDSTGLGMDSNETLTSRYGEARWQGVDFTGAKVKRELASGLVTAFDDAAQTLPPTGGEHKRIATDLYALQRIGDKATFTLEETSNPLLPESHCDVAWSAALATRAAAKRAIVPHVSVISPGEAGGQGPSRHGTIEIHSPGAPRQ